MSLRSLIWRPMVTVVTVVTLAAGLGASAAMFSVVDALILRSFPIDGIDRLVMVAVTSPGASFEDESVAPADFLDWRAQSKTVDRLVAFEYWDANLVGRDEPERVQGFFVSPGFFEILGRSPALGRSFLDEEETIGHHRQVVLGHGLWLRRFAGDRAIIGQAVLLDGEPYTVIGIAPESFDFPSGAELWAPLAFPPEVARRRDVQYLTVVGRLDEGRTIEDARAELRAIGDRLRQQHPATNGSRGVEVRRLDEGLRDEGSIEFLTVLQASALLVLLIGCANVANLLMAVGAARQRELAVRVALGASRPRLVRQLLLESGVLGVTAAAASLPLTWLGVELIRTSMPANIARFILGWQTIDVDGRVVLFTLALAVTTSMLFGTWPALQASNPQLAGTLKEGGRGTQGGVRHRVRRALVVGEIALALMLLVAAALNISGSIRLIQSYSKGFDPDNVLTWRITLPELKYEEADRRRQFVDRVLERVRAIPGITDVAVANVLPASGSNTSRAVVPEGHVLKDPRNPPLADYRTVSPDYFRTLRIPILRGRPLDRMDTKDGVAVAIVSQALADRHWPGQDPIGRRLRVGVENPTLLTIVGVAGDVVHHWFGRRNAPTLYRPFAQDPRLGIAVAARTASDPAGFTAAARTTVLAIDPTQPIHEVRTMRRHVLDSTIGLQYIAVLMGVFGAIAVVLASVGVYAVMSCLVAQRTHEFGVRLALGATARDVVRLSVGQVGRLTVAGLGLGLVLAAGLARVMASALFGVVTTDVRTFVAGAATLGTVALLAGYIPARRAAAVDAVRALASQ